MGPQRMVHLLLCLGNSDLIYLRLCFSIGIPTGERLTGSGNLWNCWSTHTHTCTHTHRLYKHVVNLFGYNQSCSIKVLKKRVFFPFQLCCSGACWTLCQLRTKRETWCSFWLLLRTSLTPKSKPSKRTRRKVSMYDCRRCVGIVSEWILRQEKENSSH